MQDGHCRLFVAKHGDGHCRCVYAPAPFRWRNALDTVASSFRCQPPNVIALKLKNSSIPRRRFAVAPSAEPGRKTQVSVSQVAHEKLGVVATFGWADF